MLRKVGSSATLDVKVALHMLAPLLDQLVVFLGRGDRVIAKEEVQGGRLDRASSEDFIHLKGNAEQ